MGGVVALASRRLRSDSHSAPLSSVRSELGWRRRRLTSSGIVEDKDDRGRRYRQIVSISIPLKALSRQVSIGHFRAQKLPRAVIHWQKLELHRVPAQTGSIEFSLTAPSRLEVGESVGNVD
jgi:hypothetical protein